MASNFSNGLHQPEQVTQCEQPADSNSAMSNTMPYAEVEKISWYHPNMTRHLSEGLLMANGDDGSYLLRPSKKSGQLSLSVRCANSVKHFAIGWDGQKYTFGMGKFDCLAEFVEHFENKPLIGGDSEEPDNYDTVRIHAVWGRERDKDDHKGNTPIATHEGFLTKQGGRVKSWRTRYFVVVGTDLKYFKAKDDELPLRTLDLTNCKEVSEDHTQGKSNCFKIVMPSRTFYCYASTRQEADKWMKLLHWKMKPSKQNKA
ncbi:dual adapter for phosphotyrosine and 3-phosphotyrosine and 3-phosphoinositide-like isoform X2 [Xenia sp. Carnegie-2017]|uniref:dual adapter for phosphotyrosine and 3-phosphotyrosine and 3-phosphoinositide-like isoform X2 n=1 Tax=Xenia sp. Carnegie-2017 TaxID=2897299 RepID=UPI001F039CD7|nr:dual adapter for phosphotyrosine and 3-phosphotyrosine and 3-phosphoinositide-like isoform X2 [Xenia sp. Carnegie-2017]